MTDQRGLFRISVHRKGFLRRRGDTTVCEIYDLTEKGLQIVTETPLGRIIQISTEHQEALIRFLEHMIAANLVGLGSEPE